MILQSFTSQILLASLLQSASAQVFCKDVCFYSKQVGRNIEFRIEAPQKYAWVAVGLGSSMSKAEVFLGQLIDGVPSITRRVASGYSEPRLAPTQDLTLVKESSGLIGGNQVYTFTRSATASPAGGSEVSITSNTQSLIWAVRSGSPGKSISKHSEVGKESGNLLASSAAFTGQSSAFNEKSSLFSSETMVKIHGWTMIVAWLILAPVAIASARFFKGLLGDKWFKIHWILLGAAMVLTIVGFSFIVARVNRSGQSHFSPSNYNTAVGGIHVIAGLIIFILTVIQVVSGYLIDKWFNPSRKSIPISDKFHWWLGRSLFTFALINVMIGLYLYSSTSDSSNSLLFYLSIAWGAGIVAAFGIFQYWFGQTHDAAPGNEEKIALDTYVQMR